MIKDINERNKKLSLQSVREEKIKEVLLKFTDKNGNFDYESLRKYVEDSGNNFIKEGYGLNFLGKKAAELMSSMESTTVFVPDIEHNEKEENKNSENIYISADNLEALRHLKNSYRNKIKCIYIDPPYNTGSDGFCYTDSFSYDKNDLIEKLGVDEDEAERILSMQSKKGNSHSSWLSFMYARLLLARELLSDDGAIFISIDDNEMANLKLLCDEVFGENNMINCITVKMSELSSVKMKHIDSKYPKLKESLLIYAKDNLQFSMKIEKKKKSNETLSTYLGYYTNIIDNIEEDCKKWEILSLNDFLKKNNIILTNEEEVKEFKIKNADKMVYRTNSRTVDKFIDNNPNSSQICKFNNADGKEIIKWGNKEMLFLNKYLDEYVGDIWLDISTINLNKETEDIKFLNGQKPMTLIKRILNSLELNDSIVLDFFCGSATTAHAIIKSIVEDKQRKIRYIMCQLPENLDKAYNEKNTKEAKDEVKQQIALCDECGYPHTLDYIGIERIKRAAKKIKEETGADIDYGFKHYTLLKKADETAILDMLEKYDPNIAEISQDRILDEFSIESRLITFLCDDGFGLIPKYDEIDLNGYKAYYIEKSLYLLDKGFDIEQCKALVSLIEDENKEINRLVLYGYAFSTREMQQLKDNLEKFDLDDDNIDIKY